MIKDLSVLLGFWALILAPCLMAMKTGLHRNEAYESKEFEA